MKVLSLAVSLLLFLATLLGVVADIAISQPVSSYNVGETFDVTFTITGDGDGILAASLRCGSKDQIFFSDILFLEDGGAQTIAKSLLLSDRLFTKLEFDDDNQKCTVVATFQDEEQISSSFSISNKLVLEAQLDKTHVNPGDTLRVEGTVVTGKGQSVNGLVSFSLDNQFLFKESFTGGSFSSDVLIPTDLTKYLYDLEIFVNDSKGQNYASAEESIAILRIPTTLQLNANAPQAGEQLVIRPAMLDQNANSIDTNITVVLTDPSDNVRFARDVESSKEFRFSLPSSAEVGSWKLTAQANTLQDEHHFFVDEFEKVNTILNGTNLVVMNVGNVPITKPVEVIINNGTDSVVREVVVDLRRDEEQTLVLSAPNGSYAIEVEGQTYQGVPLTGGFVDVSLARQSSYKDSFGFLTALVIILILVFIAFNYISHTKLSKEVKEVGQVVDKEKKEKEHVQAQLGDQVKKNEKIEKLFSQYVDKDVADMAVKGDMKQGHRHASFLFTDLRGYSQLADTPEKTKTLLDMYCKIITKAVHQHGGMISQIVGDCVEAIFNVQGDQKDHVMRAVQAGISVMRSIELYNKNLPKGEITIKTGVGVDTGKVFFTTVGDDNFKRYQPIGDAINTAYFVSKESKQELWITKRTLDKLQGKIKAERVRILDVKGTPHEIYRVIDHAPQSYVKQVLKQWEKEGVDFK